MSGVYRNNLKKKNSEINICDNGGKKAVIVHLECIFYYSRIISDIAGFSEPLEWSWLLWSFNS